MEEDDDLTPYDWSEDEDFVAELEDRYKRWEKGIDKAYTLEEAKAHLKHLKEDYLNQYNKELEEGEAQIDKGIFLTHDEVKKYLADRRNNKSLPN